MRINDPLNGISVPYIPAFYRFGVKKMLVSDQFAFSRIKPGVRVPIFMRMVIALLEGDILGDELPIVGCQQNYVGLNRAGRVNDCARADPAVMANAAAQNKQIGGFQVV